MHSKLEATSEQEEEEKEEGSMVGASKEWACGASTSWSIEFAC